LKRLLFLAVLVLTAALWGCGAKPSETEVQKATAVRATTVRIGDIAEYSRYGGKISAFQDITVIPKMGGKVDDVLVDVGQQVQKGDLLVKLEDPEAKAQLKQAEASLAIAEANQRTSNAATENARINLDRLEQLFREGAISQQQLESAQLQYKQATSGVSEAVVRQAAAAVDLARTQEANTIITSPIDGHIAARFIDPGEMAVPGLPVMSVVAIDSVYADINITEADVARIKPGQQAEVRPAPTGKTLIGKVNTVAPAANPQTKTFAVRILLENGKHELLPGMLADVQFVSQKHTGTSLIPPEALVGQNDSPAVFVVSQGKAKLVRVTTGLTNVNYVEVVDGLTPNQPVIIEGQQNLSSGSPVKVVQ